ncbi:MAG: efflux RND transporter permease subunit [Candidatus Moduliflexus flocculans]|nr:efflux RND transporter permease subunit [Candidatus Moduliflexus flocculans]
MINATLIIIVVFVPLFFLSGIEGRLLRPLGVSYMVSIGASLIVALTVTPAMCAFMLRSGGSPEKSGESAPVRWLKKAYRPVLDLSIRRPMVVITGSFILFALSLVPLFFIGRSFLPAFNEGSFTVMIATAPGTSLEKSSEIGNLAERILLKHPNVVKTSRKTGRAEMDEHGKAANASEIEARLDMKGRKLGDVLEELRRDMAVLPGTVVTFGQPISHRIDHMLSGTTANIAVKIFGPELFRLRAIAEDVRDRNEQRCRHCRPLRRAAGGYRPVAHHPPQVRDRPLRHVGRAGRRGGWSGHVRRMWSPGHSRATGASMSSSLVRRQREERHRERPLDPHRHPCRA